MKVFSDSIIAFILTKNKLMIMKNNRFAKI